MSLPGDETVYCVENLCWQRAKRLADFATQERFVLNDLNFFTSTGQSYSGVYDNPSATLTLGTDNNATFAGDVLLADSKQIKFGAGADLQIFHNGTHSYINQSGTGDLFIRNTTDDGDVYIQSDNGSGGITSFLKADGGNGTLQLFHYGSLKASTTSAGISVTGEVNVTGEYEVNGVDVITSARALTNITGITSTGAFKSSGGDSGTSGQLINAGGSAVNQTNSGTLRLTEKTYDVSPYFRVANNIPTERHSIL